MQPGQVEPTALPPPPPSAQVARLMEKPRRSGGSWTTRRSKSEDIDSERDSILRKITEYADGLAALGNRRAGESGESGGSPQGIRIAAGLKKIATDRRRPLAQ